MTKENRKIAVLGVGVMGGAILNGILTKKFCSGSEVTVYDLIPEKVRPFVDTFGVKAAASAKAAVQGAEVVVLAVKPQYINALMEEIAEELDVETLVISIAAGAHQLKRWHLLVQQLNGLLLGQQEISRQETSFPKRPGRIGGWSVSSPGSGPGATLW